MSLGETSYRILLSITTAIQPLLTKRQDTFLTLISQNMPCESQACWVSQTSPIGLRQNRTSPRKMDVQLFTNLWNDGVIQLAKSTHHYSREFWFDSQSPIVGACSSIRLWFSQYSIVLEWNAQTKFPNLLNRKIVHFKLLMKAFQSENVVENERAPNLWEMVTSCFDFLTLTYIAGENIFFFFPEQSLFFFISSREFFSSTFWSTKKFIIF